MAFGCVSYFTYIVALNICGQLVPTAPHNTPLSQQKPTIFQACCSQSACLGCQLSFEVVRFEKDPQLFPTPEANKEWV